MKEKIDNFFDEVILYVLENKKKKVGADKVSLARLEHARDMIKSEIEKITKEVS